jgi:hypothetical protein
LADVLGATTRSIVTILVSCRPWNIVIHHADRAVLIAPNRHALQAIIDADTTS